MALDFGLARVGVALSYGTLAEPLEIVPNTEKLLEKIATLCVQHNIELVVVGQSEKEMAELSQKFAEEVRLFTNLPIAMFDETLSSVEVHRKLAEKNRGKQQYKGAIDHLAAAHFLQQYLDENYTI